MSQFRHGTPNCYKHKPCRCPECRAANAWAQNQYRLGRSAKKLVSADMVRDHARWLCSPQPGQPLSGPTVRNFRWTYRTLAEYSGMNYRGFCLFMNGTSKKILHEHAKKILMADRKLFLTRKPLDRADKSSHNGSSRPVGVTG